MAEDASIIQVERDVQAFRNEIDSVESEGGIVVPRPRPRVIETTTILRCPGFVGGPGSIGGGTPPPSTECSCTGSCCYILTFEFEIDQSEFNENDIMGDIFNIAPPNLGSLSRAIRIYPDKASQSWILRLGYDGPTASVNWEDTPFDIFHSASACFDSDGAELSAKLIVDGVASDVITSSNEFGLSRIFIGSLGADFSAHRSILNVHVDTSDGLEIFRFTDPLVTLSDEGAILLGENLRIDTADGNAFAEQFRTFDWANKTCPEGFIDLYAGEDFKRCGYNLRVAITGASAMGCTATDHTYENIRVGRYHWQVSGRFCATMGEGCCDSLAAENSAAYMDVTVYVEGPPNFDPTLSIFINVWPEGTGGYGFIKVLVIDPDHPEGTYVMTSGEDGADATVIITRL